MSDYIKREDAIKRILQQCDNDCLYCMFNWQNDSGDYCAVEECFSDIPSADVVERKRGKWIRRGIYVFCSNCQNVPFFDFDGNYAKSKYCPNCGAEMKRSEE